MHALFVYMHVECVRCVCPLGVCTAYVCVYVCVPCIVLVVVCYKWGWELPPSCTTSGEIHEFNSHAPPTASRRAMHRMHRTVIAGDGRDGNRDGSSSWCSCQTREPGREAREGMCNFVHVPPISVCPFHLAWDRYGQCGCGAMCSLHRTFRNLEQGSLPTALEPCLRARPACLPRLPETSGAVAWKRGNLHLLLLSYEYASRSPRCGGGCVVPSCPSTLLLPPPPPSIHIHNS